MRLVEIKKLTTQIFSMKDLIAAGVPGEAEVDKFLFLLNGVEKDEVKAGETIGLLFHRTPSAKREASGVAGSAAKNARCPF